MNTRDLDGFRIKTPSVSSGHIKTERQFLKKRGMTIDIVLENGEIKLKT